MLNPGDTSRQWRKSLQMLIAVGFAVGTLATYGAGGIVSDGSLGAGTVGFGAGIYTIPGDTGTRVGGNLFHSFSQFSLLQNETALFKDLGGIDNVIARVTGGSVSSIDGRLSCAANLFLVNQAGVVFGPNASIADVTGSFTVSTASYVSLGSSGKFFAALGQADSLVSSPISAFGFASGKAASVEFQRTKISTHDGASLHVIAGGVTLDGASISTFASAPTKDSVSIFSAASQGVVPFSLAQPGAGYSSAKFAANGKVALRNGASIDVSGEAGGRVVIRAGKLTVDASSISTSVTGSGVPRTNLELTARALAVFHAGSIASYALSDAPGGSVAIKAGRLDVAGDDSLVATLALDVGRAGDLRIVADAVGIRANGSVFSRTSSSARGGDVFVKARVLSLDSGVLGTRAELDTTGRAGDVTLDLREELALTRGALVTASTFGFGRGGNVRIAAGSVSLDGSRIVSDSERDPATGAPAHGASGDVEIFTRGELLATRASFVSASTFGPGNGGKVSVVAMGGLTLSDRAAFTVGTQGTGRGGSLFVQTSLLLIDGRDSAEAAPTGFVAQSKNLGDGPAGSISVEAGRVTLLGGGIIEATTGGANPGGSISVVADEILLDGHGARLLPGGLPLATAISARTVEGATGEGGNVVVTARGAITLREGGEIESATEGSGRGGDVRVRAGNLSATGSSFGFPSGVLARGAAGSTGAAGDVRLDIAGNLRLAKRAEISSNNLGLGRAGSLQIAAVGNVALDSASLTVRALNADAGNLALHANRVTLRDSAITAQAAGTGGNIVLGARFLSLEASLLTASAVAGNGGLITLEIPATGVLGDARNFVIVSEFVSQDAASRITASSEQGVQGVLLIDAPQIDLANAIEDVNGSLIDASKQLRDQCARRLGLDFSSLVVLGRGGVQAAPDEPQAEFHGGQKRY